jgi:serine/threonine protein phosphatase PrpC
MVEAFGVSDIGPVRENNEDCLVSNLELNLFVVADGMGGQAAGEVAARIAVESVEDFIRQSANGDEFTWPFGLDPSLSPGANRLRTALLLANRHIVSAADSREDCVGMGTTAVCALLAGRQLTIAHVGDSRLYLYDNGTLVQLTKDDSWMTAVSERDGNGNAPAPGTHPYRHVLTNVLGAQSSADVHLCERELSNGALLLLCSDGLHGAVEDETLRDVLGQGEDLQQLGEALVSTALAQGTRDNVTALLVRYLSD